MAKAKLATLATRNSPTDAGEVIVSDPEAEFSELRLAFVRLPSLLEASSS